MLQVENSVISIMAVGLSVDDETRKEAQDALLMGDTMLQLLFPAVLRMLRYPDYQVAAAAVPCLLDHVAR